MKARPVAVLVILLGVVVFASAVSAAPPSPPPPFRVIVNPRNPVTGIDRTFLQDAFLKRGRHWPDETIIKPIDLPPSSPTRRSFTQDVLGRSVTAVRAYWQQRIFSGRDVPPPELASDERVVEYVLKHEQAVGYVSAMTPLAGAKAVSVSR
jgi:ABC-type phosphate transport system substrate-binding protein